MDRVVTNHAANVNAKFYCMILTCWAFMASVALGLTYYLNKVPNNAEIHLAEPIRSTIMERLREKTKQEELPTTMKSIKINNSTDKEQNEFKLKFKTIYVLSKVRKDPSSHLHCNTDNMNKVFDEVQNFSKVSIVWTNELQNNSNLNLPNHSNIQKANATSDCVDVKNSNNPNGVLEEDNDEGQNDTLGMQESSVSSDVNEGKFFVSQLVPSSFNLFFLETSCAANQSEATANPATLSEKQACAIYSAAYHNPLRKVILLFTCPVPNGHNWTKDWKILFDLPNFFFARVVLADLYADTFVSLLYHGPLAESKFAVSHQSDVFRQFVLYMYGGTYMDLDVISFKSLDDLGVNYLIHEGNGVVTAGVFNFEPGHFFLHQCLVNGFLRYVPNEWSVIGPVLYTKTLRSICNFTEDLNPSLLLDFPCNIRVLPVSTFFSVGYPNWKDFYNSSRNSAVEEATRESHGIHYWNHLGKLTLHVGSKQPLVQFAKRHCPPIYCHAGPVIS